MAKTLLHDKEFDRFNVLKETSGNRFRLTPKNSFGIFILAGVIPVGLTYLAYATEGEYHWNRLFRRTPLYETEYVPRDKDL
ncbi:hypothetical protein JA1_004561 [Spathaspora sp. JA1]|nr:hypothetical protein JA1_004561 [Spathaspora sp. JA1]